MLSQIYKLLESSDSTTSIPTDKWLSDLTLPVDTNWQNICKNMYSMTCNSKTQLIQYKILHRTHLTNHKLFRMGLSPNNTCPICTTSIDDYMHAMWHCPPIQAFWSEVVNRLSEILNFDLPIRPVVAIFGDLSAIKTPLRNHESFILISLPLAKKAILLNWKDRSKISINHWLNLLAEHSNLEKITAILKSKIDVYESTWLPFLNYLQS